MQETHRLPLPIIVLQDFLHLRTGFYEANKTEGCGTELEMRSKHVKPEKKEYIMAEELIVSRSCWTLAVSA